MPIKTLQQFTVYDLGFDAWLSRPDGAIARSDISLPYDSSSFDPVSSGGTATVPNTISGVTVPSNIGSGELQSILSSAKQSFTDTTEGYRQGLDVDGIYKWIIGGATSSIDWSVTTLKTLTVNGTIVASLGITGGFTIGPTTLSSGATNIILDSANKSISINNATFGQSGIQLQYNAGTPRAYIGNGTTQFFQFNGTNISWGGGNSSLDATGKLTTKSASIGAWSVGATTISSSGVTLDSVGNIRFGKTGFADAVNAGLIMGINGVTPTFYFGTAGDASYMKLVGGVYDMVGTISSRSTLTLANAINSSGNLITDVINARLDSSAKTILSDFNFGAVNYAGAVKAGTITWDVGTGAITGGSGVIVYRGGIVGANIGVATFTLDAATGNLTLKGQVTATSGSFIGGVTVGTGGTFSSGQSGYDTGTGWWMDYNAGSPRFSIGVGTGNKIAFSGTSLTIRADHSNFALYEAVVDAAGFGDYTTITAALAAGKKKIFVRKGVYTESPTISVDDVSIVGEGTPLSASSTCPNIDGIVTCSSNAISFTNIQFSPSSAPSARAVKITTTASVLSFKNCFFTLTNPSGVGSPVVEFVYDVADSTWDTMSFDGCTFFSSAAYPSLKFTVTATNSLYVYLRKFQLTNCVFSGGSGILTSFTTNGNGSHEYLFDALIANNDFFGSWSLEIVATEATVGRAPVLTGIQFQGNRSYQSTAHHILTSSVTRWSFRDFIITNNHFDGTAGGVNGIFFSALSNSIISNNIVRNSAVNGIYLSESDLNTVEGNECTNNAVAGIRITTGNRNVLDGNVCYTNTGYGINITDAASNKNIVTSNVMYNNTAGQFNDAGTGTVAANNVVT